MNALWHNIVKFKLVAGRGCWERWHLAGKVSRDRDSVFTRLSLPER